MLPLYSVGVTDPPRHESRCRKVPFYPLKFQKYKRRAMEIESLRVNYIAYITGMKGMKMLVGLHGEQAKELYRCLTEQGYAMEHVKWERIS